LDLLVGSRSAGADAAPPHFEGVLRLDDLLENRRAERARVDRVGRDDLWCPDPTGKLLHHLHNVVGLDLIEGQILVLQCLGVKLELARSETISSGRNEAGTLITSARCCSSYHLLYSSSRRMVELVKARKTYFFIFSS
jgi:hypothetical protein